MTLLYLHRHARDEVTGAEALFPWVWVLVGVNTSTRLAGATVLGHQKFQTTQAVGWLKDCVGSNMPRTGVLVARCVQE